MLKIPGALVGCNNIIVQVLHLDEKRSVEGYRAIADETAGELPHYLLLLYQKVIEGCLVKHSRRQSSEDVRYYRILSCNFFNRY